MSRQTIIYTYDSSYILPFALEGNYTFLTGRPDYRELNEADNLIVIVEDIGRLMALSDNNQGVLPVGHYIILGNIYDNETGRLITNANNYILRRYNINSNNLTIVPEHFRDDESYIKRLLEQKMRTNEENLQLIADKNKADKNKADVFEEVLSQRTNLMNLNNAISNNNNNNNNNFDQINLFEMEEIRRGRIEFNEGPVQLPQNQVPINGRNAVQNLAIGIPNFIRNKWFLLGLTSSVLIGGLVYLVYKSPIFGKTIQNKIPNVTTEFINSALEDGTIPTDSADIAQLYIEYIKVSPDFTEEEHKILNPVLDNIVIEENIQPADTNITPDYAISIVNPGEEDSRLQVIKPVIIPELYLENPNVYYGPENMPIYDQPENRPIYDQPENNPNIIQVVQQIEELQQQVNEPIKTEDIIVNEQPNNYIIDIGKTYEKNMNDGIFPFNTNINIEAINLNIIKEFDQQNTDKYLLYAGGGLLLIGLVLRLYK